MSPSAGTHVFGIHAVSAVLRRRPEQLVAIRIVHPTANPRLQRLRDASRAAGVPVVAVAPDELDRLAGGIRHQGVMGVLREVRLPAERELEALLAAADDHPPLVLVLDGVQDPHNLGACLRSAAAAGVHAVVVPKDRAVGLTPVVRKVACGAAERLPFIQVTNLARTLRRLKDLGLWVAGAEAVAPQTIYEADLSGPLALVMGAEGKGLRRLTRESCDLLVSIPMAGTMDSLNVSVAAGICLFEAKRQRLKADP